MKCTVFYVIVLQTKAFGGGGVGGVGELVMLLMFR